MISPGIKILQHVNIHLLTGATKQAEVEKVEANASRQPFQKSVFVRQELSQWQWMQTGGQLCNYTIFTASSSVCERRISITPVHNWLN